MDDVMSFYNQFYHPNNAILVVSGDVEPDEVRTLAEKYYGVIPAYADLPPRARTSEPPQIAERRITYRDPRVAQPNVSRSYHAPERDPGAQEDAAALTLLAEILGGGTTSYMTEKMLFDEHIAVYAGAFYAATALDDTTFDIVVVPGPNTTLAEAEARMDAALQQFFVDGVDEEQLDRIKMQLRASQIYARDDVDRIASRYGRALTSGLTVADVQAWPDILQAVTAEDIMAAARNVFQAETSVTGYLTSDVEVTQ